MNLMMEAEGVEESAWWNGAVNGGDVDDDAYWHWDGTGESLPNGAWQTGEPSVGGGSCAVMESTVGYTWKAVQCDSSASVICQIEAH